MEDKRLEDSRCGAADGAVAVCDVGVRSGWAEMRNDEEELNGSDRQPRAKDRRTGDGSPSRHPVPESEAAHDYRNVLVRSRGKDGDGAEPYPALLVQPPECVEEQRQGEIYRVEAQVRVQRVPLRRGVGEVGESEIGRGSLRAEMLPREPVDR